MCIRDSGYTAPFRHWLETKGYDAGIVETRFGDESEPETAVTE